jgi:hypothetical protein
VRAGGILSRGHLGATSGLSRDRSRTVKPKLGGQSHAPTADSPPKASVSEDWRARRVGDVLCGGRIARSNAAHTRSRSAWPWRSAWQSRPSECGSKWTLLSASRRLCATAGW